MEWYNTLMLAICCGYVLGDMIAGIVTMIGFALHRFREKRQKDKQAEA